MKEFLKEITPREYQQKIFETCNKKNCLVVLPTGLGKTLIALMLTIERMKSHPGEKVVMLAPTKPLVEQHLISFKKYLPELFADIQMFTGTINAKNRKKIWQTADIIFSTPQCVANDLKNNLYNLSEVCLLIEDEAHRCVKNYDYNYLAKKYLQQASNQRIIGLTASPGNDREKITDICRNLAIEEVELRTRESPDVKKYLQELDFKRIKIDFPPEFLEIKEILKKLFNSYIAELKNRKVMFRTPTKTELIKLQTKLIAQISNKRKNFNNMMAVSSCAQAIKLQHAIELLETQTLESFHRYLKNLYEQAQKNKSKGVKKLVSKPEFSFAFVKSQELLSAGKEHPKISKLKEIIKKEIKENSKSKIIVFTQFRDTANLISKTLNQIPLINSEVFVGQAKKTLGEKTTGLSQKEQKKIIQKFSSGEINILAATCIAEEGLDIPEVNAVIFYEPVASAIRTIQRAGRTARLNQGKLIILTTTKTRDEAFYYTSKRKQDKMQTAIKSIKDELNKNGKLEFQKKL